LQEELETENIGKERKTNMNGILGQTYCAIVGKELSMRVRIILRIINAIIIVVLYTIAGVDWVIVYGLIVVIADIDAIAEYLEKKGKDAC
jgi:hypothetical protein